MGRLLLVAEDGYGVRVIDVLPRHGQGGPHDGAPALHGPRTVGRFETSARITAITAVPQRFYVATDEYVTEVDARDLRRPAPARIVRVATPVRALAANGSNLYVLGLDGLRVLSLAAFASSAGGEVHPALRGSSMVLAGRTLRIAAGSAGIVSWRDATPLAQLHPVSVENNFFSPASVTIDVGDWIQWTNSAGFHNVFSCNPGQTGCAGSSSTETFTSGPPAPPLWEYSYQFTLPGPNPYICQSHATTMAGLVTVSGASASPPVVPDGTNGTPMRVSKLDPSGATLSVSWDTSSCTGAADHEILYGVGSRLPNTPGGLYWLQGAQCSLGLDSPYAWSGVPDPSIDETRLLWWLVVATDAVDTEGPWGADSTGIERSGIGTNGSSNRCGITDKDLGNPCGSR
jgi:plastocyanin